MYYMDNISTFRTKGEREILLKANTKATINE
jgi:hypothetical protein